MFTELTAGIFSVESRFVEGKNGIILGERGALAIDGSNFPDEGQAMADFIRNHGCEPDRLLLTHGHNDHILGAAPLAGGEIFAHARTPGVIADQIPGFAERWGVSIEEATRRVTRPTIVFWEELWIDLGDRVVWAFPTPGHSVDGVSIYVAAERLLFAGDSVVTGIVPAIANGDSRVLEASLARLQTMEIETLVPGHGRVLHGADAVQDWLRWQASYLSSVRHTVQRALAAGTAPEMVVEGISYEEFVGDRLPVDRHNMPKRHRDTVQKIVEEISADESR